MKKKYEYKIVKKKSTAVLLAVFFGLMSWLYTYKVDKIKFWVCLGVALCTFGLFGIVAWIWAMINQINRNEEFFQNYDKIKV